MGILMSRYLGREKNIREELRGVKRRSISLYLC